MGMADGQENIGTCITSYSFRFIRFISFLYHFYLLSYSFCMQIILIYFDANINDPNLRFAISLKFILFQIRYIRVEAHMRGRTTRAALSTIGH